MLTSQLASLKQCFEEHQNEVKDVLAQAAKLNQKKDSTLRDEEDSPTKSSKKIGHSPKNYGKGLFFKVGKDQQTKTNISPSFTKASSVSSWQNKKVGS